MRYKLLTIKTGLNELLKLRKKLTANIIESTNNKKKRNLFRPISFWKYKQTKI